MNLVNILFGIFMLDGIFYWLTLLFNWSNAGTVKKRLCFASAIIFYSSAIAVIILFLL